jgi:hypothetical protein
MAADVTLATTTMRSAAGTINVQDQVTITRARGNRK